MQDTAFEIYPIFARHETFHPRYGWLKKGYDKVKEHPNLFSKPDAPVILGVGKNMVKAIRYWCIAFKIIEEKMGEGKGKRYAASPLGSNLFAEDGWDPYLEDPSSLWILHWNLFKAPCYAPAWYCSFNDFNIFNFTTEDLLYSIRDFKKKYFPTSKTSDSSILKDINCLLRMYVERKGAKSVKEETIDCPFSGLGIMSTYSNSRRYAFNFGNKISLSNDIIVSACLEYSSEIDSTARSISVSRLAYDPRSPGQVFKLTENAICNAIEKSTQNIDSISITETAGVIQFTYLGDPKPLALEILDSHFNKRN